MHSLAFGEGERLANEAAQALSQGAEKAFGVVGLAFVLAAETVRAPGKSFLVGQPEVAARGPAMVLGREALAQGASTLGRTIPDKVRHNLAGLAAKCDPDPAHVGFAADKAPKFVQFQHVAGLGSQKRVAQRREAGRFFLSQPVIVLRPTPKTRAAARRLSRSVATDCNTSLWRSGLASRLLGCKTRHAPHARQRNCWRPQAFLPFLTMRSLPQRVQRGAASAASEDVLAIAQHRR